MIDFGTTKVGKSNFAFTCLIGNETVKAFHLGYKNALIGKVKRS